MPRPAPRACLTTALVATALAVGACQPARQAVRADVNCHLPSPQDVAKLHRVVFVELDDASGHPGVARSATSALYKGIQARRLFHVDIIWRDDPVCRDVPFDKREAFTLEDLTRIRQALRCDALLFGKITNFLPYPRMQVGLYLRLLDLKQGKLLWAVDHIWDMTDRTVEARAQDFYENRMRDLYGPTASGVLLMSPAAFHRFVAFEVSQTLAPQSKSDRQRQAGLLTDRRVRALRENFENY